MKLILDSPLRVNTQKLTQETGAARVRFLDVRTEYKEGQAPVAKTQQVALWFENPVDEATIQALVDAHNPLKSDKEIHNDMKETRFRTSPEGKWLLRRLKALQDRIEALENA